MTKYPITDENMLDLLRKYPFLKIRKLYGDGSNEYLTDEENIENNYYKIWDGSGWENLWKNRYLLRLFKLYDSWDNEKKQQFNFTDIKEKFGTLRIYTSVHTDDRLENIAENISKYTCTECGKEPRTKDGKRVIWTTGGWITNLCRDCVRKYVLENAVDELPEEIIEQYVDNMKNVQEKPFGYKQYDQDSVKEVIYKETPDGWLEVDKIEYLDPEEEKKKFIESFKGE